MLLQNTMRGGGGLRIITPITIAASTSNYNLFTAAGSPTDPVDVVVTINSGVTISSASTASYAFDTGIFPSGSNVTLTNNGIIVGRGGNGGAANADIGGRPGGSAGPALRAQSLISIINNNRIAGGGGGGGGGGNSGVGYGGGGGGIGVSTGGTGTGGNGAAGTLTAPGNGGDPTGSASPWDASGNAIFAGVGGKGGSYGAVGGAGADPIDAGVGGAAGAAVVGNSNITWVVTGTRNGAIT